MMDVREAFGRLQEEPGDAEAIQVLSAFVAPLAARVGCTGDADELADLVLMEILELAHAGRLPPEGVHHPAAWVRKRLFWRHCDLHRPRRQPPEPEPASPPDDDPACPDLLRRVAAHALAHASPRFRDGLERRLDEIAAIVSDWRSVREVVILGEGLDPSDQAAVAAAMVRANKQHGRARMALLAAVADLARRGPGAPVPGLKRGGGFTAGEAEDARACILRLLRVRKPSARASTGWREPR